MTLQNTTRWTVTVSKETDAAVRNMLVQRGLKKGGLSQFIEEAVKWRLFDQTLIEARESFSELDQCVLQNIICEASQVEREEMQSTLPSKFRKPY
jgi:hypothetical protein